MNDASSSLPSLAGAFLPNLPSAAFLKSADKGKDLVDHIMALLQTHFDLGGTLININIVDSKKILEAHKDPQAHPNLIVRVTGFSAYFSSLSKEFRQLVVDRIIEETVWKSLNQTCDT